MKKIIMSISGLLLMNTLIANDTTLAEITAAAAAAAKKATTETGNAGGNTAVATNFGPKEVDPQCTDIQALTEKNTAKYNGKNISLSSQYPGSAMLQECDKLSLGNMKDIYRNGSRTSKVSDWTPFIKIAVCNNKEDVNELIIKAKRCDAAAYIISAFERDWTNEEHINPSKNQASAPMAQNNQQSATQIMAAGQTLKCVSEGVETLDYEGCKKFSDQLGLLDMATTFTNNAQTTVYSSKLADKQIEYSQEENTGTGALKAQGASFDMQQDMYQQRATIDGAKLAYLYSIYEGIPTTKDLSKKCGQIKDHQIITKDNQVVMTNESVTAKECNEAASAMRGRFAFLQNQAQLDNMKSKLIGIATSLGSNALLSKLMGDRAKDVKKAIAGIDAFAPIDPVSISEEALKQTLCKTDPTNIKCSDTGLESDFDSIGENIIVFGSNATGTNYGQSSSNGDVGTIDDSTAASKGSVDSIGSIVDKVSKDEAFDPASAAKVTSSGSGRSGGGGGGSAGGAGLGGSGDVQKGTEAAVTAAKQSLNAMYGGGGGSLSVTGGMGINKKNATGAGDENPFGKLFNKDQKASSDVVNFREIASTDKVGTKNDDLFKMISNRYNRVNAEKRLIEYELAK